MNLCATLSKSNSLQITLYLPISNPDQIMVHAWRWKNLFIIIPEFMTDLEAAEDIWNLLKLAKSLFTGTVHWYRDDTEIGMLPVEPVMDQNVPSNESKLHWASFEDTWSTGENTADTLLSRMATHLFVTSSSFNTTPVALLQALNVAKNLHNLHFLTLSHAAIQFLSNDISMTTVTLPYLKYLKLDGIGEERSGGSLLLFETIRCPNLGILSISGKDEDILNIITYIGYIGRPPSLHVTFTNSGIPVAGDTGNQQTLYNLFFIETFRLTIEYLLTAPRYHMERRLSILLKSLSKATVIDLTLPQRAMYPLTTIGEAPLLSQLSLACSNVDLFHGYNDFPETALNKEQIPLRSARAQPQRFTDYVAKNCPWREDIILSPYERYWNSPLR
ncbi:hypothetical protein M408DRAFT_30768 [Serendipita vermifera MAFF 305830]|uniref:Uncharacterized protein n=1 Tax=Serendipita vermifera MAFF 305830 TaxID=933852 RepID=A0A0C3A5M1_SERVB|nr:hypothetical protein M408DRAFT_30768 [Serendipita vermifera MAFF 305830]